jgi:hypothetical protein
MKNKHTGSSFDQFLAENNVTIHPFKHKHLPLLHEILDSNQYEGTSLITTKNLPKIGYIVMLNGKVPLAAGFLRRLEPYYGQIDTLCSNKFLGSILRHQGLTIVVNSLIDDAKQLKLEGIVCHTKSDDVLKRAELLGFKVIEEKVIALGLKK